MTSLRIPFVFGMEELVPTKMPPFQFLPNRSISRPKIPLLTTYCAVSALTVSVFAGVLATVPVHAFMGAPPAPVVPAVPVPAAPPRPAAPVVPPRPPADPPLPPLPTLPAVPAVPALPVVPAPPDELPPVPVSPPPPAGEHAEQRMQSAATRGVQEVRVMYPELSGT